MNPIITSLSHPPSMDFYQQKELLNREFDQKGKIQGLVSYVYYPSMDSFLLPGHTELEIEGNTHTLMTTYSNHGKPLSKMIKASTNENGLPLICFHISTTPHQLRDLKENVLNIQSGLCSVGVAKALSKHGEYSIPLPLNLSPLLSAAYLTGSHFLGSSRVKKIDIYAGNDPLTNFKKIMPGIIIESLAICGAIKQCLEVYSTILKLF